MAGRKNFTIEQGATFERTVYRRLADRVTPDPITGMNARMQIRAGYDSTAVIVSLTSSPAAGLTVTGPAGQVDIRIGADVTAGMPTDETLVYDLELVDASDPTEVIRLLGGEIVVSPEVTR